MYACMKCVIFQHAIESYSATFSLWYVKVFPRFILSAFPLVMNNHFLNCLRFFSSCTEWIMRYEEGTQCGTETKARTKDLRGLNLEVQVMPSPKSSKWRLGLLQSPLCRQNSKLLFNRSCRKRLYSWRKLDCFTRTLIMGFSIELKSLYFGHHAKFLSN